MTSPLRTNFLYYFEGISLHGREVTLAEVWSGLSSGIQTGSSKEQTVMLDLPFSFSRNSEPQSTEWCHPFHAVHNPVLGNDAIIFMEGLPTSINQIKIINQTSPEANSI